MFFQALVLCIYFLIKQYAGAREHMPLGLATHGLALPGSRAPSNLIYPQALSLAFWPVKLPRLVLQSQEFTFNHPHLFIFFFFLQAVNYFKTQSVFYLRGVNTLDRKCACCSELCWSVCAWG